MDVRCSQSVPPTRSAAAASAGSRAAPMDVRHLPQRAGSRLVVLADDDYDTCEIVASHLLSLGFFVATAQTGDEAVELVTQLEPDVVVLDLVLPGLDGWGAIRALKERHATREIPIIAASGFTHAEVAERLDVDGCTFLAKPYRSADLVAAIERAVELRSPAVG
jgi:CheY-like chemotaxis protein